MKAKQLIKGVDKCVWLCGPHLEPCNRKHGHSGFCYHLDVETDSEIPCIAAVAQQQADMNKDKTSPHGQEASE